MSSINTQPSCCNAPVTTGHDSLKQLLLHIDWPVMLIAALGVGMATLSGDQGAKAFAFVIQSLFHLAPWMLMSVGLAAFVRASHAQVRIARAFQGSPLRMTVLATLAGALSPLCSCGVIPFVAGLLASGVPLGPVMAFWLSSPLMDPNMFVLTAATLGIEFAVVKTLAAIFMGLMGGMLTTFLARHWNQDALRRTDGAHAASDASEQEPAFDWRIWSSPVARQVFLHAAKANAGLLLRWMTIAFLLESIMMAHLPAERVVGFLGHSAAAIPLAVGLGIPAYLNGLAALPLMSGLIKLGMAKPVALAFLVAGGVTSIPAAAAVWALVRPKVFGLYLGLALGGSLLAAYAYAIYLSAV
jgi:uncharacterized membrane protein YraQ (UPF0718 family)